DIGRRQLDPIGESGQCATPLETATRHSAHLRPPRHPLCAQPGPTEAAPTAGRATGAASPIARAVADPAVICSPTTAPSPSSMAPTRAPTTLYNTTGLWRFDRHRHGASDGGLCP